MAFRRWTSRVSQAALFLLCGVVAETPRAQTSHPVPKPAHLRSHISVYDLRDHSVHVLYTADSIFEAPNWSPDGKYLLTNSNGKLYRLDMGPGAAAAPQPLALDASYVCNNDKAISPGGTLLAFSATLPGSKESQIFLAASDGSQVHLLVSETPSYFHGWSPDGRSVAFVSKRGSNFDIYRISAQGGQQERLTEEAGHNDGPDYSPDGRWIYINSDRSGTEQIWRLPAASSNGQGNQAERVTADATQDWFPHPSPDGKWLVFLTFPKEVQGHGDRVQVELRLLPINGDMPLGKTSTSLNSFFGGQGTINVNSWSPDSTRFAFVSYEPLP